MRYDLHIHTHNSACSILKPRTILKIAKRTGLNGIAIADHNSLKGGIEVKKENKDRDFEVIPAIEVNTDRGHVVGLYINKEIKGKEFFSVCDQMRKQGGLVVLAHPFRLLPQLRAKVQDVDLSKCVDAIECFNGRTSYFSNRHALKIATLFDRAQTGGSDAHFSYEVGRSYTLFEGDLYDAIKKKKTKAGGSNVTGLVGSVSSFFTKHCLRMW